MYAWTCRSCMLFATKSVRYWSLPWQKTQFEAQLQILQRVHHWSMVGVLFHIFFSFSSLVPEMLIGRSSSRRTSFPLLFVCLAKNLFDSPKMLSTLLMLENKRSIIIVVFKKKSHNLIYTHDHNLETVLCKMRCHDCQHTISYKCTWRSAHTNSIWILSQARSRPRYGNYHLRQRATKTYP